MGSWAAHLRSCAPSLVSAKEVAMPRGSAHAHRINEKRIDFAHRAPGSNLWSPPACRDPGGAWSPPVIVPFRAGADGARRFLSCRPRVSRHLLEHERALPFR
jgi:hypothetical protein